MIELDLDYDRNSCAPTRVVDDSSEEPMEHHDAYTSSNRRFFLEATALIVAAAICAVVANAVAAKNRKVALVATSAPLPQRPETTRLSPSPELPAGPTATIAPIEAIQQQAQPLPATAATPVAADQARSMTVTPATRPGVAPTAAAPSPSSKTFPPHPDKPWVEIDSADAKLLFDRGAPFFDARRSDAFAQGHIRGAVNISVWESDLDEKIRQVYERNIDPAQPIVVYCTGGACEDSHLLSERLWGIGLNAVYVYKDGYPDWLRNGWPTNR